jgi:Uma2 family endonuclease
MSTVTRFSLKQYERMIEGGVFEDDRRLEFLRGEIVPMSPIGIPHARIVNYLTRWSINSTSRDEVEVSVQNPILVPPNDSAPEPDLAWIRPQQYTRHPTPADIFLVIEVSDTTLTRDTIDKASIYAEGGIADYWVVDLPSRVVHVHRDPLADRYATITMVRPGEQLSPLTFSKAVLDIGQMFRTL